MNELLFYVFSFLPILTLAVLSIWKNIRTAAFISFLLTTVLYFLWGASLNYFIASLITSMGTVITILMIVFGAVFLYKLMESAHLIHKINKSLETIHHSEEIRFYLIAISLTAFFEGVAGFGTPGAIVPLLLITAGFNPVLSVSVVLLLDGLFATFGAVGTPLTAGLMHTLNLQEETSSLVAFYSALFIALVASVFVFFIFRMYETMHKKMHHKKEVLVMFSFFFIPFIALSAYVSELSTLLSAAIMLLLSYFYLTKGKSAIKVYPWIPYLLLILLLLLPKVIAPLQKFISIPLEWNNILSTPLSVSLTPLRSPLIPFLIVAVLLKIVLKPKWHHAGRETISKVASVLLLLFPIIAVSQMMLHSGPESPSMIGYISHAFSHTGYFYPLVSPLIAIAGTFITGSTTVSNIVLGASQQATAQALELSEPLILSLQLSGAAIGNAVCLFNIVAAATVANVERQNLILVKTISPTIAGGMLIGILGIILSMYLILFQ